MTTVTLYKDSKVNGTTRCSNFATLAEQRNYFNGLTKKVFQIQAFTLGEPVKLNSSIADLLDYGYLSIDYGDGFRYYCYVTDLEFVTTAQSRVIYTVDAYETSYLQCDFRFGRCNVYRGGLDTETYKLKEVTGTETYTYEYTAVQAFSKEGLYYVRRDSENNILYYGYFPISGQLEPYLANGSWISKILEVNESDIWIAGVLPVEPLDLVFQAMTRKEKTVDSSTFTWYESDSADFADMEVQLAEIPNLLTTVYEEYVIRDMRGNNVYTFRPYQAPITGQIKAYVIFNASSISLKMVIPYSSTDIEYATVPSELIDVYVDSWKEYYYRQRESDLQARKQQVAESTVSGMAGVGISAASGLGLGFMMGGPAGAAIGAVAGLALGVLGVGINSGVQSYYNQQSQKTTDRAYQLANDTLNQTGNYTNIYSNYLVAGIWLKQFDEESRRYTESEIANNGKYLVGCTTLIDRLPSGPFQGECEILGSIPNNWVLQIQQRLLQGVYVV